jgi:hypothetical protein
MSGKREAGSGRREAGSGRRKAGGGRRKAEGGGDEGGELSVISYLGLGDYKTEDREQRSGRRIEECWDVYPMKQRKALL